MFVCVPQSPLGTIPELNVGQDNVVVSLYTMFDIWMRPKVLQGYFRPRYILFLHCGDACDPYRVSRLAVGLTPTPKQ